jgi:NADPH2:quinone reductase
MKAIRVHAFGDAQALRYEDVPDPQPGAGEALIRVKAAGVNFIDIYHRLGWYPLKTPFIVGLEAAGTVEAVGEGVTEVVAGDRVAFGMINNAYAEKVVAPARHLVPVPDGISAQQAAALMIQGLTAHYLACDTFPLQPGQTALIHAAAGGTGALLVQVAKKRGARVLGTVSTAEKEALARESGADEVIRYTEVDFEAAVKDLTGGAGVEVVYDSVGKDTFDKSLNCLKPRGYLVLFGQASGPVEPFDPQILNRKGSLFLTRPSLGAYVATREELLGRARDLFDWIKAGELTVRIDMTFPLSEAAEAHRYMEARKTQGKVLLIP